MVGAMVNNESRKDEMRWIGWRGVWVGGRRVFLGLGM